MEQGRVLGHHGDGAPQVALADVADVLAVDEDAPVLQVVEPLDQLHERRLARPRGADQRHPLARRDGQVEVLVEGAGLVLVAERHLVEDDLAQFAVETLRVRPVGQLRRRLHVGGHVHGVVQTLLQHAGDLAEVPHVAGHDDEGGDGEGHVAGRRPALVPGADQQTGQPRLQGEDEQVLAHADDVEAVPGAVHRHAPGVHRPREPDFLPRLGPEALDHRIGADGVGQGRADPRIQGVGDQVRRADVLHRQDDVVDREGADHDAHEDADPPPAQAHGDGQAGHHDQGGHQHQQQGVRGAVVAPHGPRNPPHRGAGEVGGVPVGGERLHPLEALLDHPRHDPAVEAVHDPEGAGPRGVEQQVEPRQHGPGAPGRVADVGLVRDRVHQAPGRPGDGQVAGRGGHDQQDDQGESHRLAQPVAGDVAQDLGVAEDARPGLVVVFDGDGHRNRPLEIEWIAARARLCGAAGREGKNGILGFRVLKKSKGLVLGSGAWVAPTAGEVP